MTQTIRANMAKYSINVTNVEILLPQWRCSLVLIDYHYIVVKQIYSEEDAGWDKPALVIVDNFKGQTAPKFNELMEAMYACYLLI